MYSICMLLACYNFYINVCVLFLIYSEEEETETRGRHGRQQTGGDTYTLEISFPAVKYVCTPF